MMCDLTNGVFGCKDSIGGIKKLYLSSFVDYKPSQIDIDGVFLLQMPLTYIYLYDVYDISFNEDTSKEGGAVFFNQNITIKVPKTASNKEMYKMIRGKVRAFYVDRNNVIRVAGLFNGLTASYTNETGNEKTSFNGYNITLTGKEENQAFFINDLTQTGVITQEARNYIYQDGNNFIYNDGVNNYIFNG